MRTVDKAISNTFYLSIDWLVVAISGYLYWVIIGKLLQPADAGVVSAVINFSLLISGLSTLGLLTAVSKLLPEYEIKGQKEKLVGTIWWTFKIIMLLNVIIGCVIVVSNHIFGWFSYSTQYDAIALSLFLITMTSSTLLSTYLQSMQRMKRIFTSNIVLSISKILATLAFMTISFNYIGPLAGFIAASALVTVIRLFWMPKGKGDVDTNGIRNLAVPSFLAIPGALLVANGSVIALTAIATATDVGLFGFATIISSVVHIMPNVFSRSIFPISSQQWAIKTTESLRRLLSLSLKYSILIALPMVAFSFLFSREIILLLSKQSYIEAKNIIGILAAAFMFYGISNIFTNTLYSMGEAKRNRDIWSAAGAINIVSTFILYRFYGIVGAAFALLISTVFIAILTTYFSIKKTGNFIHQKPLIKIIISMFISFIASSILKQLFPGYIYAILIAVVFFSIYSITLLSTRIFEKDDRLLIERLETKIPSYIKPFFNKLASFIPK